MTPAAEDALIKESLGCLDPRNALAMSAASAVYPRIRLAIRAAVAQERERCAKVCEDLRDGHNHGMTALEYAAFDEAASAIRRGE